MPSPNDCATLNALFDGVDYAAQQAEETWGQGRLPLLVDDELRAKFYRQEIKWREDYEAAWTADVLTGSMIETVKARAAAMKRAWEALAAAASEAGHRPISADVIEARLPDGTVMAIVRTNAELSAVTASGRYLVAYTADEIANVIGELFPHVVTEAKRLFPGATVKARTDRSWVKAGESIPFGD